MAKKPSTSFIFLADSHEESESGKINTQGIFNQIYVWATPTSREFSIVIGFSDVPKGLHNFKLVLVDPKGARSEIGEAGIEAEGFVPGVVKAERVTIEFKSPGGYRIGLIPEGKQRLNRYVRFEVAMRQWPKMPRGEKLTRLLKAEDVIKSARVVFVCGSCKSEFTFQVNLDPKAPIPKETQEFPKDGVFECPKCGSIHHLKDVEGRLLSMLAKPVR